MNRIVNSHHLEDRYFERMAGSLGDKKRILDYLPPVTNEYAPKVLDIGAGGGEFSFVLTELGYNVTAIDASDEAVNRIRVKYPQVTTATLLANQVDELPLNNYDAVVCSSILHEAFSYGDNVHKAGHISSLVRALKAFHKVLKPGGRVIIRDGVLPKNWEASASVQLMGNTPVSVVYDYLKMCPFANGKAYGNQGSLVKLEEQDNKIFTGNVRSVLEFSYTYTWGIESYPRETQELYAVLTLEGYRDLLMSEGFNVIVSYSYLQSGYPEHLQGVLDLKVDGEKVEWFDSNAIWVAVKP